jgi:hypothetical protein
MPSLVSAAVLVSATSAIVSGGVQAGAAVAGTAVRGAVTTAGTAVLGADKSGMSASDAGNYFVDSLFRIDMTPIAAGFASAPVSADAKSRARQLKSAACKPSCAKLKLLRVTHQTRLARYQPMAEQFGVCHQCRHPSQRSTPPARLLMLGSGRQPAALTGRKVSSLLRYEQEQWRQSRQTP